MSGGCPGYQSRPRWAGERGRIPDARSLLPVLQAPRQARQQPRAPCPRPSWSQLPVCLRPALSALGFTRPDARPRVLATRPDHTEQPLSRTPPEVAAWGWDR